MPKPFAGCSLALQGFDPKAYDPPVMGRRCCPTRLAIALGVSPLLHAILAAGLFSVPILRAGEQARAGWPSSTGPTALVMVLTPPPPPLTPVEQAVPEPDPITPKPPPRPDELRLGIDRSDHDTDNWLGFADPTPHRARKSETEQPALTREVPSPEAAAGPQPQPQPAAALAAEPETPDRPPPSPPDLRLKRDPIRPLSEGPSAAAAPSPTDHPRPANDHAQGDAAQRARPAPEGSRDPDDDRAAAASPFDGPGEDAAPDTEPSPSSPRELRPSGAPGDAPAQHAPGEADNVSAQVPLHRAPTALPSGPPHVHSAEKSDKESDAASLEEAVNVRPGRPAAARGLDIITRRPVFTTLTTLTTWPENPVVRLTFNRRGRVSKVEWIRRSGYPSVDEPVLNALYAWTARGQAINDLSEDDADAGVSVVVRVILR
jgi:hypothetical protein